MPKLSYPQRVRTLKNGLVFLPSFDQVLKSQSKHDDFWDNEPWPESARPQAQRFQQAENNAMGRFVSFDPTALRRLHVWRIRLSSLLGLLTVTDRRVVTAGL